MDLESYGNLFEALHANEAIVDGKALADSIAREPAAEIRRLYEAQCDEPGFDVAAFYHQHFSEEPKVGAAFESNSLRSPVEHVRALWATLTRSDQDGPLGSSRIALPHPYVVPGGRFSEIFYWDSYFTMLGLIEQQEFELVRNMVDNFAWLIDRHGFVPNGSRTYFASRSQPPFFALMVQLLVDRLDDGQALVRYLPQMQTEHGFWMTQRSIDVAGGQLNRYDDPNHVPRTEMHGDDMKIAAKIGPSGDPAFAVERAELFRNIRAACESGWDFGARWTGDSHDLTKLRTIDIAPIDLNCLLFNLERTLAKAHEAAGNESQSADFAAQAATRRALIQRHCWNEETGLFHDFNVATGCTTSIVTAATYYALCFDIATAAQAERVAEAAARELLAPGGLRSTNVTTSQQWDAPNGWAPLQWMAVTGLRNHGFEAHADQIAQRWIAINEAVYKRTGRFVEKYNVEDLSLEAGGGEYELQDGFGWTNGVYLALRGDKFVSTAG